MAGPRRIKEFFASPPGIFFFILLILVAFASNPISFAYTWNQGLGALVFIPPLALLELGSNSFNKVRDRKSIAAYSVVLAGGVYYVLASQAFFTAPLASLAVSWGITPVIAQFSWVTAVDYAFSSVFVVALCLLDSKPVTPWVYTIGMTAFLLVDTVLPYNSVWPLQELVTPTLWAVAAMVNLSGYGHAVAAGNILNLSNASTSMNLAVYWPSAGLDGMIIAVLAIAAVSAKLRTGWVKGSLYTGVGLLGSIAVNTFRIGLLAIYALSIAGNQQAFDAFHSVIGEILFLPWIAGYIFFVVRREGRISRRRHSNDSVLASTDSLAPAVRADGRERAPSDDPKDTADQERG